MRVVAATMVLALAAAGSAESQERYNALWGLSPTDVWAVGDQGNAAHFVGTGWVGMRTGTTHDLRDVWASGPRDVWAVGDEGTILRMTGTAWTWVRPPVARNFVAVRGCGPNDVWVVGQSGDAGQPPALLHWDGSNWTVERAPFAFRPGGLSVTCAGVAGGGAPGVTLAGVAFFDPRPDQVRAIGVLMRRSGNTWTTQGYDGRAMTDPQIGGASWTSVASGGGATLIAGSNAQGPVALLSRGGSWSPLPSPNAPEIEPGGYRYTLAPDGTPIAVFENGFARYTGGRWAVTSAGSASGSGVSSTDQARYAQLAQQMQAQMARGQQPTAEQIQQLSAMGQQMASAGQNAMAAAQRAQTMAYGEDAVVYALSADAFFVASRRSMIFKVTGETSEAVWSITCMMQGMEALEPCSNHAARGARAPAPASGEQPQAPPETAAPEQQAPGAPRMPSVPGVRPPRIPRP